MMEEIFKIASRIEKDNYPIDHRDCIRQAVREVVPENELIDTYTLYGITYEEYIEDVSKAYLRYKSQKVSNMWQKQVK